MNYLYYIKPELLILIPVLYLVGMGLKKSKISSKKIPAVLGSAGVVLSVIWVVATVDIFSAKEFAFALFTGITQGVLVAGASVYVNQLYKQTKKNNKK